MLVVLAIGVPFSRRQTESTLEIRQLIHDMSLANPLWGAPRIHHAQYLDHWLNVTKANNKSIFTAASKALCSSALRAGVLGLVATCFPQGIKDATKEHADCHDEAKPDWHFTTKDEIT
jgi:antirestriction protein ArdC